MATPKKPAKKKPASLVPKADAALLADVRKLIADARELTATAVNTALVLLYWQVGYRIRTEVLGSKRADYGEEIVSTLSRQLAEEFGDGFSRTEAASSGGGVGP